MLSRHLAQIFGDQQGIRALVQHHSMLDYYEKCLGLSWKMVLQQPQMLFRCEPKPGGKFDDSRHELHFGSADPSNSHSEIHYYVHPALYHGTKQMRKARIVLHINIPHKMVKTVEESQTIYGDRHHGATRAHLFSCWK